MEIPRAAGSRAGRAGSICRAVAELMRESPVQAGRRRSNPSPEPLRHQDRMGETPLESDGRARPPTGKAPVAG